VLIKEDLERVRVLRLANPPSNVLNLGLLAALRKEVAAARADDGVRCLLLSSAYPRYFSTGLDLAELTSLPPDRRPEFFDGLFGLYRDLSALPKPTLAAISGTAFLGGWILAMACDFRLMTPDGRVALAEIRMGFTPTPALIGRMRRISSSPAAVKEMVLRGKTLRAQAALAAGLVDELVAPPELEARAASQAKALSRLSAAAYARIKAALDEPGGGDQDEVWRRSRAEFMELFSLPETQEGLEAMRDKRRPKWEGADV